MPTDPHLDSFEAWYARDFPDAAPFQRLLCTHLEKLALRADRYRNYDVEIPPGHAKTTLGTYEFIPWYMAKFSDHNVMLLSYDDKYAHRMGREVRNICAGLSDDYPQLKPLSDSHAAHYFSIEGGGRMYSGGFNGNVAGNRVDLLVMDDSTKSMTEARSTRIMAARYDIYRSVVKHRRKPKAIMVAFNTRHAIRDLIGRIIEAEGNQWRRIVFPAEDKHNCGGIATKECRYLWEGYIERQMYEDAKKDPEVWSAIWQQDPNAHTGRRTQRDWLQWYEPKDLPKLRKYKAYMICDPGRVAIHHADRTSMPVFVAGPEERLFLVDWVYDRLDPDQRADAVVRLVRKWKPARFIYEAHAQEADLWHLSKRLAKEQIEIRPVAVGQSGKRFLISKEERIDTFLRTIVKPGRFYLPRELWYTTPGGQRIDLVQLWLEEEYDDYQGEDTIAHDDGLDSFSRLLEPELRIEYASLRPDGDPMDDDNYEPEPAHGTWEGVY